jgi:hypothetical protein
MYNHYCYPDGFWYDDRFYGDDPVVTDDELQTFNADEKIGYMLDAIQHERDHYLGNHILIPMGCDFTFANARLSF